MFQICNGCRKHIKDLKTKDMVEEHCLNMKSIANDIVTINYEAPSIEIENDSYYEALT